MSKRRVVASCFVVAGLMAGCAEVDSPSEPIGIAGSAVAIAASGPAAIDGFTFLPPVAADEAIVEEPDASLLDLLAVEICEWTGTVCVQPLVARITAESPLPGRLQVSDDGIYQVLWDSRSSNLDPARTYRIRVLASGGQLGYAEVDVVDPGEESDAGSGQVRLVHGRTLPIRFVIEQGTGDRVGSEGGTIELADGAVKLEVPPGALPGDVFLTAMPATDLPAGGPPIVPGTAWDFGPDGIVFAQPVVMTIAYDPADVPPGVDENELRIHKVVDGGFVQQDAGLVDLVDHTISAEVDGFSVFVTLERDPASPEDIEAPVVRALEVSDGAGGPFSASTTLDVSGGDAVLTTRIRITDNGTGVRLVDIRYLSPSRQQVRFPCFTAAPPTTGNDTNGAWICQATFPRHAEGGIWRADFVGITDRVNNTAFYFNRPAGFCDQSGNCIADIAEVVVNSATPDVEAPVLHSLMVSPDVQPRMFGSTASVDVAAGARTVFFGFHATDNLSGTGDDLLPFDRFLLRFGGPSGQDQLWGSCNRTQGTASDGFWECIVSVPAQAETGTWRLTLLRVPDRAGNGGFTGFHDFHPDGLGQLCNISGNCVPAPTVEVTSQGDAEAPAIQSLAITETGPDVTTTLNLTDDVSGVSFVRVRYESVLTTQFQECFPPLGAGTPTNGTWACTISFSPSAALGQWVLSVEVRDIAGNARFYSRRPSDGFLCYFDPDLGQVCQDFGDTDLILE